MRSLTLSENSSLNFLRLLLDILVSDLTSTGKISFSRWNCTFYISFQMVTGVLELLRY